MTLRELCGWARTQAARVRTDDGWPVVNGQILTLGIESLTTGVVRSPEQNATIATWQLLSRSKAASILTSRLLADLKEARERHEEAETTWAVRS